MDHYFQDPCQIKFPHHFASWIYTCISSVHFSLNLNGNAVGYFKSNQGIRQGCPMSSYIFILVMEVLTVMINHEITCKRILTHPKCKDPLISTLMFADDLIVFTKPTTQSISNLMKVLNAFHKFNRLAINLDKSSIKFAGFDAPVIHSLTNLCHLPLAPDNFTYLGIPLSSSKVSTTQCMKLYDKITHTMKAWANRFLSQAGRLTLIKSVIFSFTTYWSRTFILPKKLIHMIRKVMCNFLWFGSIHSNRLKPFNFCKVETKKSMGGLGIINIRNWNTAAFSLHLDNLLNSKNNIWVSWTKKHHLSRKNFWCMDIAQGSSWTWRSVLNLRPKLLPHIKHIASSCGTVSFWNDPWARNGLILSKTMTYNQIIQTGIPSDAKAKEFICDGAISLPYSSNQLTRQLWQEISRQQYPNIPYDRVPWSPDLVEHSISKIYECVSHATSTSWFAWGKRVWNHHCKENDNFLLWKVLRNAMNFKDKLLRIGLVSDATCCFCADEIETNIHLYFSCKVVHSLLNKISALLGHGIRSRDSNIEWCYLYRATRWKNVSGMMLLLVLKKFIRFIWRERNERVFNGKIKSEIEIWNQLIGSIKDGVRNCSFDFGSSYNGFWY